MTYIHRKFSEVEKSLGIEPYEPLGKLEDLEITVEKLRGVVIALVCILEREGVLSLENSDILDRVQYNYYQIDRLDSKDG